MSLMFILSNVIREHFKGVAEAITSAQATFLVRDSTIELSREIDEVDAHVVLGNKEILAGMPALRSRPRTTIDLETLLPRSGVREMRMDQDVWNGFNNLGLLIEQAAPGDPRVSELNALYKEWDGLRLEEFKPISPIGDAKVNKADAKAFAEASDQERTRRYLRMMTIREKLQMLAGGILDDAHSNLIKKERLLTELTPLIDLLFFTGVLLTLITQWAGIEGIEAHRD